MSAGKQAIPLAQENPDWKEHPERVLCVICQWQGFHHELLCEPDEETVWCPQCRGSRWIRK